MLRTYHTQERKLNSVDGLPSQSTSKVLQIQKSQNLAPAPDFPPFEYFIFDARDWQMTSNTLFQLTKLYLVAWRTQLRMRKRRKEFEAFLPSSYSQERMSSENSDGHIRLLPLKT